ncbi:MAG: hypothetical protein B5M51_01250 [Anaerolinea sp. 4484_236]|nr:MAG: hypothetical protein B5M51_01250 [Anaerolinea sp. 4484_236]
MPDETLSFEKVRAVKRAHEKALFSKPNVVGVGVGFRSRAGRRTDSMAIVVMVSRKLPASQLAAEDLLPQEIEGVPVDVQETGELKSQVK